MARVVVTEPADADTAEIQAYLEREAGSLTASKYSNSFEALSRAPEPPIPTAARLAPPSGRMSASQSWRPTW